MSDASFAEAMYDEIYGLNCTIGQLTVENAKLRELVRDMLACINNVSAHDTYCWDYCDFCKMYTTKGRCDFESRMRELGVEV